MVFPKGLDRGGRVNERKPHRYEQAENECWNIMQFKFFKYYIYEIRIKSIYQENKERIKVSSVYQIFCNVGHLSTRMQIPGNIWTEAWQSAKPVPARRQKRLFDDTKEAEKVRNLGSTVMLNKKDFSGCSK